MLSVPVWITTSPFLSPRRPASDLHDCLDHLFLAPKVGAEQANIGIQNSHQRDVREMMTLGQHLGTQQDNWFPLIDFVRQLREGLTTPRRVAVNSEHRTDRYCLLRNCSSFCVPAPRVLMLSD